MAEASGPLAAVGRPFLYGAVQQPTDFFDVKKSKLTYEERLAHIRAMALAFALCCVLVGEGYDLSIMNGALLRIRRDMHMSSIEQTMLGSMQAAGQACGTLLGGAFADVFGRRPGMLIICLMLSLIPMGMGMSITIQQLITLRFFVGLFIGAGYVVMSSYITELSPKALRGRLTALQSVSINAGNLMGFVVTEYYAGVENDWRYMFAFGSFLPFMMLLFLLVMGAPESPRWLVMRGEQDQALGILNRFLGPAEAAEAFKATHDEREGRGIRVVSWLELLASFKAPTRGQMILASIAVGVAGPACGAGALTVYSSTIFRTTMSEARAFKATIGMGIGKLCGSLMAIGLLEDVGRRRLLLVSGGLTVACNVALACSFAFSWSAYIEIALVVLLAFCFEIGLGPLSFTYCSEVLDNELRSKGMALTFLLSRCVSFCNLLYLPMLVTGNPGSLFVMQSVINTVSMLAVVMFAPETKGKSLEDMHEIFA